MPAYETFWAPVLLDFTRPLLEAMPVAPGARVLDLGCGVGALCGRLADMIGPTGLVIGADLTPEMLARTHSRLPELPLVRLDAARLPLRDRSVDAIVCAFVLHHVREQRRALAEALRSLKPAGRFGLITWSSRDPGSPAFEAWEELLEKSGAPPDDPDPPPVWLESLDTADKVRRLLSESGFAEIRAWQSECRHAWTAETLAGYRLGIGAASRRLEALPAGRRAAFRVRAMERLARLSPAELLWQPGVVCAVARAPAGR